MSKDHGVPIAAGVFRRADSRPKLCFAPDSELPDQAESPIPVRRIQPMYCERSNTSRDYCSDETV